MAPPDPPSPTTYEKIGELVDKQQLIELAIASDCPLSSASTPGNAPGVSIKVTTGKLNFAANSLFCLLIFAISNAIVYVICNLF